MRMELLKEAVHATAPICLSVSQPPAHPCDLASYSHKLCCKGHQLPLQNTKSNDLFFFGRFCSFWLPFAVLKLSVRWRKVILSPGPISKMFLYPYTKLTWWYRERLLIGLFLLQSDQDTPCIYLYCPNTSANTTICGTIKCLVHHYVFNQSTCSIVRKIQQWNHSHST